MARPDRLTPLERVYATVMGARADGRRGDAEFGFYQVNGVTGCWRPSLRTAAVIWRRSQSVTNRVEIFLVEPMAPRHPASRPATGYPDRLPQAGPSGHLDMRCLQFQDRLDGREEVAVMRNDDGSVVLTLDREPDNVDSQLNVDALLDGPSRWPERPTSPSGTAVVFGGRAPDHPGPPRQPGDHWQRRRPAGDPGTVGHARSFQDRVGRPGTSAAAKGSIWRSAGALELQRVPFGGQRGLWSCTGFHLAVTPLRVTSGMARAP